MPNLDIVELYKKGYSIEQIINLYYTWKTKGDIPNKNYRNLIIKYPKSMTKENAKKDVYKELYFYNFQRKNLEGS